MAYPRGFLARARVQLTKLSIFGHHIERLPNCAAFTNASADAKRAELLLHTVSIASPNARRMALKASNWRNGPAWRRRFG